MKYCEKCGFQMFDRESRCLNCGHDDGTGKRKKSSVDTASIALIILSFFIPISGLVLWFLKKEQKPNAARTYLIVGLVMWLINLAITFKYFNDYRAIREDFQIQNEYQYSDSI